jgi:hypothetical protein
MTHSVNSRQETNLALENLYNKLGEHNFTLEATSFYELFQSIEADYAIFHEAKTHGIEGVLMYLAELEACRSVNEEAAHERGMISQKRLSDSTIEYLNKQLEATRKKYMKPIDFFMEKLEAHDWYYEFSDDIKVYRRGKASEEELKKEAQENGPEFKAAWQTAFDRVVANINKK